MSLNEIENDQEGLFRYRRGYIRPVASLNSSIIPAHMDGSRFKKGDDCS